MLKRKTLRKRAVSEEKLSIPHEEKEAKKTVPSISYFTLYRYTSRWEVLLIVIALTASFIAGVTLPYAITLVAEVFQNMINYAKSNKENNNDTKFLNAMHRFGINYSIVGVIVFLGGYLGSALMNIAAINQVYKIRQQYIRAALNQDFSYYDMYQTGDFASKMAEDVMKLEEGIGEKVAAFVLNCTVGIGCVTMSLIKGWKLALLCLTTAPVTFLLVGITGRIADRLYKKEAVETGKASAIAEEVLASIRTVYAFSGQRKEIERYSQPLAKARQIYTKKEIFTGLSMCLLFICIFCSYALSFYFGIYLIINDPENYNADVMFSVFFGVMTGLANIGMVGSLVSTFGSAKGAGAQIFFLLDRVPTINPLLDEGTRPEKSIGTVELQNVVFHYPSRPGVTILNGINLKVNRGQSIALVGHSGCGKSTILELVSRNYDVVEGNVYVDGHDVRRLSVQWLRGQIGLVGQEPVLFNTTVRENIRYGREDANDSDVEIAAVEANAHFFILKLPQGYDTLVGERGAALSGGQKQRIAIARALIRNPSILLLDEATSALDTFSEAKVQAALDKAAKGRTTIIVAHRLSTIRNVDIIFVMKNGKIIESGNHEQLMTLKGHYYDMKVIQDPENLGLSDFDGVPVRESSKISEYDTEEIENVEEEKETEPPHLSFWHVVALNAPEWKSIVVGSISSVIIGFSMPIFILVFGDLFGSMSDSDPAKLMEKVKKVASVCVGIGLLMGITNFIEALSFGKAGAYLTERLRLRMFTHLLNQDIAFFDKRINSTGALCARLSSEAANVQGATGQRIGILLQGVGSIGLALILAMAFEWRVGLVALAFFPIIAVVVYQQSKVTSKETFGYAKTLENSTKIAVEAVSNVRTVASLGREKKFISEYEAQLQPALAPARKSAHCRGIVAGMSRSMFNFVNAAALTYGGHLIVSDNVPYENILITTQSLQMASGQAQNAFTHAPNFQKGISAASRIVVLLNMNPRIQNPSQPIATNIKPSGEATFEDVKFSYPTRQTVRVLQGLNLKIERGKTIAVVGKSGCGKSTIIQLLERFYDPDAGVIMLDNYPIRKLCLCELRSSLGLVNQEPVLFDRTIEENICYGDNSRIPSVQEVIDAAQQANIHEFIVSLPQGYQTNIGSKGIQLSGGQKQRIAIARALVRRPKILLLDEATSALDTESEKVVQEALDAAKAGRTCVMIAHRLSTVRDADVICVLQEGRIVEMGTHEQLIALKGLYYRLQGKPNHNF